MRKLSTVLAAIAVLALVTADSAWAARTGGRAGARAGFAGGGASRPGFAMHHHRGRAVFFVGSPFLFWSWPYGYYYAPPPYYYGPDYLAREFDGTPTPQTPGEIYCPGSQAYYPDVQECSNGWQRIIREPESSG